MYDCEKPDDVDDIPAEVTRHLEMETEKGKSLIPYVKNLFIPVTHVLEYREHWEDADNDRLGLELYDEFYGIEISSLRRVKGEREYYKRLRELRRT